MKIEFNKNEELSPAVSAGLERFSSAMLKYAQDHANDDLKQKTASSVGGEMICYAIVEALKANHDDISPDVSDGLRKRANKNQFQVKK